MVKYIKCSEIIDVRDGTHDSPKYINEGGYPLVTSKNIKDNMINFENINYISSEDFEKINQRSEVVNGDIIMPMIGTIGNPVLVNTDKIFAIKNVALFKLAYNEEIDSKFFYYVLKSDSIVNQLNKKKRGGTQNFVSLSNIRDLKIPYFDMHHQRVIVRVLDVAQNLVDKRKEQIQQLEELVKSKFIEMFGDVFLNTKNFEMKQIKDIVTVVKGITYKPEQVNDEGTIVLRSSNIKGSTFDLNDIVRVDKKIDDKFLVEVNDILMCNRNGSERLVGKVAKIPEYNEPMTFGTFMTIVRSPYYNYLFSFFQTEAFRRQIKMQTSVAINQISIPLLESVKVPLPPIELQNEFGDFVKQVDKLKFEMEKSLKELEDNFNSLMQRAFKGEFF